MIIQLHFGIQMYYIIFFFIFLYQGNTRFLDTDHSNSGTCKHVLCFVSVKPLYFEI